MRVLPLLWRDRGFAGIGLLSDSSALGPASLPALAHALVPARGASVSAIGVGEDEWHMSSVFDPGLGSVRGRKGVTLRGSVDFALQDGTMPG